MSEYEFVSFDKRFKPLPPGYAVIYLDSGHFQWVRGEPSEVAGGDWSSEGPISVDKFWVRRCVFENYKMRLAGLVKERW